MWEGALEGGSGHSRFRKPSRHPKWSMTRKQLEVGGWREREAGEAWSARHFQSGWNSPGAATSQAEAGRGHCFTPEKLGLRLQPSLWPPSRQLRSGPVCREHHDRVLHDGADAGLGRGLLYLQPHAGRPRHLPRPLRRQRLLPRWPLSQAWAPSPAQGGLPGPFPTPACSACGAPASSPCQYRHPLWAHLPSLRPQGSAKFSEAWTCGCHRVPPALCSVFRLTPPFATCVCLVVPVPARTVTDHQLVSPSGDPHLALL